MLSSVRNCFPSKEHLDHLYSRYVSNAPDEAKQSFEGLMFLVESAHWYYEDNVLENDQTLKSLSLREFTCLLFNNCDVLRPYLAHIDGIFRDFCSYKFRIPVAGAIILDETYERCLLVKGWTKSSRWSFPRGKKNEEEEDHACAIREVLEETGFDVSKLLKREDYIEITVRGQKRVRLYIVGGLKEDTAFAPQTKKEISEIAWHLLDDHRSDGLKSDAVAPFLASLKFWISKHPAPVARRPDKPLKPVLSVWSAKKTSILGSYNEKPKLDHPKDTGSILGSYNEKPKLDHPKDTGSILGSYDKKPKLDHPKDTGSILGSYNEKPKLDHPKDTGSILGSYDKNPKLDHPKDTGSYYKFNTGGGKWNTTGYKKPQETSYRNFNNSRRNKTGYYKKPQLYHPMGTGSILGSYYKVNTSAILPAMECS